MKIETMKKTIVIALVLLSSLSLWSQREGQLERVKAFKTGYLTQELDLSSAEAEKFWPIYNEYEKKLFQLRIENRKAQRDRMNAMGGPDALSDQEAETFLKGLFDNEEDILNMKKELYRELSKVLSSKKLLRLYKAEADFNRRLLSEYRKRGPMRNGN